MFSLAKLSLLSTIALAISPGFASHSSPKRRHAGINVADFANSTVVKREDNARFSMYYPETGDQVACGGYYHDADYIVALNHVQFDQSWCGKQITISLNGKTAHATIVDMCPGCPYGGLDCTPGIANYFGFFNDLAYGSWWLGWGDTTTTTSKPPPPPSSTYKPPPKPSSTWSPPPSSSSSAWSSSVWSSSSSSHTLSSTSSSHASSTHASSASSATPSSTTPSSSATPSATPKSNLAGLHSNIVNMALLALAGENAAAAQ